ncbi:hypothetical protein DXB59_16945 [Ruminococcus sp. OM05-10BH]|nr:hypothetical protein B5E64_15320 [Drancourtella sp. An12]RHV30038.1 hypothetical protein DXB59_16945 [Ruminococcus sp. OM05-10BH]
MKRTPARPLIIWQIGSAEEKLHTFRELRMQNHGEMGSGVQLKKKREKPALLGNRRKERIL